ncbi:MAG TPA: GNAT family N-acetyltransferase [Pirellulales bacterium]|nr:GNAT family N-acetyltransferase [Pirellulales bacterium]
MQYDIGPMGESLDVDLGDVAIIWMTPRHTAAVLGIENDSFFTPWSEDDFARCRRQRNCIGMVAIDRFDDTVVGYVIYELHKFVIEILNIAVHPGARRIGIGTKIVDRMKQKLSTRRRRRLSLYVSEENVRGHLWLRANEFRCVQTHEAFYDEGGTAYHFVYRLPQVNA